LLASAAFAQAQPPATPPALPISQLPTAPDKPADKPAEQLPAKPVETFQSSIAKQRAAMVIQRESVRKQAAMATEWQGPLVPVVNGNAPEAECDQLSEPELGPMVTSAATQHQLEPKLLRGVIDQESRGRPCAVSPKGARGLMQLMPSTIDQFKVDDAFDPQQNIEAGATFLKQLLDKYKGDMKLALAAYNAGPGTVDHAGAIPDIKETRDYVDAIMKKIK
jgi:soluble lytic murein transglycosylase-like protein